MKSKKPTVKQLQSLLNEKQKAIDEMAVDLLKTATQLDNEQKSVRLPSNPTVVQYNSIIDYLNEHKPEPVFPKEVPAKIIPMGEGGQA